MVFKKGHKFGKRFEKGHIPWNKCKNLLDTHKENISNSCKGRNAWNKGLKGYNKGHIVTSDTREKIRKNRIGKGGCFGENNPNWNNGSSFEPYGLGFNSELKNYIRWMDNFACQQCGISQTDLGYNLCIHHIDFNKQNNQTNNLISLCRTCHSQTNFNRENWTNYFQNKIGEII